MSDAFFRIRTPAPWGDYGEILIAGYPIPPFRDNGKLVLSRTGPFAPPISFPSYHIVVSTAFRSEFKSAFPNFRYRRVLKRKIVDIDWHTWDREADPEIYPWGYEPENYLQANPHSESASDKLGDLWEVKVRIGASGRFDKELGLTISKESWNGDDFFWVSPKNIEIAIATGKARQWLEKHAAEWVEFEDVALEDCQVRGTNHDN